MPISFKYPFAMRGRIERCWLFTFREAAASVAGLVPEPLIPITRGGFAFWNVVVCEIADMRPAFAPREIGLSYWHVAYRLHVRHKPDGAPPLDGLYFVRSDADKRAMVAAGNLLTDLHFHRAGIGVEQRETTTEIRIDSPDAPARATVTRNTPPSLTPTSPFGSLFEAKAVLRYKPFALSVMPGGRVRVLRVRRDELAWKSKLVNAESEFAFFRDRDVEPEITYEVNPIEYVWERGKVA